MSPQPVPQGASNLDLEQGALNPEMVWAAGTRTCRNTWGWESWLGRGQEEPVTCHVEQWVTGTGKSPGFMAQVLH